jgi:hypothetical protein
VPPSVRQLGKTYGIATQRTIRSPTPNPSPIHIEVIQHGRETPCTRRGARNLGSHLVMEMTFWLL